MSGIELQMSDDRQTGQALRPRERGLSPVHEALWISEAPRSIAGPGTDYAIEDFPRRYYLRIARRFNAGKHPIQHTSPEGTAEGIGVELGS